MKRRSARLLLVLALLSPAFCSCRKTCTCIKNNGTSHTFTAEEVKAHDGTCQSMKYMYNDGTYDPMVSYYSVCDWD